MRKAPKSTKHRTKAAQPSSAEAAHPPVGRKASARKQPAPNRSPLIAHPPLEPEPASSLTLSNARTLWLLGDWPALASIDDETISSHPSRDQIALLVACAHQQQSRHLLAAAYAERAVEWGCSRNLVARLLISGLHNTLGRVASLKSDSPAAERHFSAALALANAADPQAAIQMRAVREMASLGLLPQAASILQDTLSSVSRSTTRPIAAEDQLRMLKAGMELLQYELTLAHKRNQLLPLPTEDTPGNSGHTAEQLQRQSPSQLGQDLWVLEKTGHKRNGFFVEFGATDGVRLSNTYLLETAFGWQGICAEPNPAYFEALKQNRRCTVSPACIGGVTGAQEAFVLAEDLGGFARYMSMDMHADKRDAYLADPANVMTVQTTSLHDLLTELGAPHDIDYISIDTEGSEEEILSSFPFDQWNVYAFTIEHNFGASRDSIHELMTRHGYTRTPREWDDWYWKEQS